MEVVTGNDRESLLKNSVNVERSTGDYRVYRRRWYILAVLCVLNLGNATIWLSFAPIADQTAEFYNVSLTTVNWLSLVYMIASIPLGLLATWLLDTLGLRAGIILASSLNLIGPVLRVVSAIPMDMSDSVRFPLLLIGQTIAAIAQPFIIESPAKVAAVWFAQNERATANMIGSMSNPLGLLLANVLSPALITTDKHTATDFIVLLSVYCALPLVGLLMSLFGVCSSEPPTPPTASAAAESESFFQGLKKLARNGQYWVLCVVFGSGLGLFSTLTTILEQVLCPRGYDDSISGLCAALMIICGVVGAGVAGVFVDKTKMFQEVVKVSYAMAGIGFVVLAVLTRYRNLDAVMVVAAGIFGFFGFALYPISLELAVEVSYPVAEATSAGLLVVSGQIQGIILVFLAQALAQPLSAADAPYANCGTNGDIIPQDNTVTMLVFAGISCIAGVVQIIFLHPEYKRLKAEREEAEANKAPTYNGVTI
ncbi:solute carrier family 49 member A3-like [Branchiostoma floridae x Branchiostoma japonicum]